MESRHRRNGMAAASHDKCLSEGDSVDPVDPEPGLVDGVLHSGKVHPELGARSVVLRSVLKRATQLPGQGRNDFHAQAACLCWIEV